MPSPAFQFYPDAWLSSLRVAMLTIAEEGAYHRLLCYDWTNDGIPDDDDQLAVLSKLGEGWFKGGSRVVRQFFETHPRRSRMLTNPRLEKERQKQEQWRAKSSAGGKKSSMLRKLKDLDDQPPFNHPSTTLPRVVQPTVNRAVQPNGNSLSVHCSEVQERERAPASVEVIVPSLAEVRAWGEQDGVPAEVCEAFYNHYAGLGWMYGRSRMTNPRFWLKSFAEKRRTVRAPNGNGKGGKESAGSVVFQKKTRLEQLEKLIDEHPGHPNANYASPATPAERAEYTTLMGEAKQLRVELAKGV